jgi:small subunit ribosomal protein S18
MSQCFFCTQNKKEVDWKDVETLKRFISAAAKIKPREKTKLCARHQHRLARAIKRARVAGLLPFVPE